jgi:enterobactin synthetase component D
MSIDWNRKHFTWTTVGGFTGTGRLSQAEGLVHTSVEMSSLTDLR